MNKKRSAYTQIVKAGKYLEEGIEMVETLCHKMIESAEINGADDMYKIFEFIDWTERAKENVRESYRYMVRKALEME